MQTNKLWMFSCTFVNVFVPLMIVCSAHGGFVASVCPSPGSCSVRPRVALFRLFMCTLHFTNGQTPALHAIHHSSFGYRLPARCRLVVRSRAYTIPAGIRLMAAGQLRFKCLLVGFAKVCILAFKIRQEFTL